MNARSLIGCRDRAQGGEDDCASPPVRQRLGKPLRVKAHLKWVSEQPCMVCGGQSQAHHLMRPWSGVRGTGMRAGDENAAPLCPGHHTELHSMGDEEKFFFEHFGHISAGRGRAEQLWRASPYGALEQGGS